MKLSENIKIYMQTALEGKNSCTVYGALYSFLPEVEKLEQEKEMLISMIEMIGLLYAKYSMTVDRSVEYARKIKDQQLSERMSIKQIKEKMLKWENFYGQDIPQTDKINSAKTKIELQEILNEHIFFLETQHLDALAHIDRFIKELELTGIND